VVKSDRPKHAYLSPMPDSQIRSRRGFAAGGNGVWGEEPALCRAPGATLGRSTLPNYYYLICLAPWGSPSFASCTYLVEQEC
jgi:hypothetical protein